MLIRSISWGTGDDPANSLTIGEFEQGVEYRTVRKTGTPNYLFILTLDGSGQVFGPGQEQLETKAGDILLFEPDSYQNYGTASEAASWSLLWSHFVPPADWNYWSVWQPHWPGLLGTCIGPVMTGRVCDALRLVHDTDFRVKDTMGAFMLNCLQRAWLYIREAEERAIVPGRDSRIQKALHFMESRFNSSIPIEEIATHCGLSVSRFAHLFKDETGTTPHQYLERRRMEQARNLIRFTNLAVGEVASACGYEDAFYFSTRFKRAHGRSPRAFRG